jgi:hypothetical protein
MKDWSVTTFDDVGKGDIVQFTPPPAKTTMGSFVRKPVTGIVQRITTPDGHWAAPAGTLAIETDGGVAVGSPSDKIEVYR